MKKNIHVVGAVIVKSGKIEEAETAQDALVREIEEELKCKIAVGKKSRTCR